MDFSQTEKIYMPGKGARCPSEDLRKGSTKQCIANFKQGTFKTDLIFHDFPKASHGIYLTCGLQGAPASTH